MTRQKRRLYPKDSAQAQQAIFDVVDTVDELTPRLQELLTVAPAGTRVHVRVRAEFESTTVH